MKHSLYLPLLAGLFIFNACEGTDFEVGSQIPEKFHKILYLDVAGKQNLTLYNTEEPNNYTLTLIKGGSEPTLTASADFIVSTQEEIDENYSTIEGINYKVVTPECYSLKPSHVDFASSDEYKKVQVLIDAQNVSACMTSDPTAKWVLPLVVTSETDSVNANRSSIFLQLDQVVTPSVGFENASSTVLEYTYGRVSTIEQEIPFKLDTDNKWNIDCLFSIDNTYIDVYNNTNGTLFQAIPSDAIQMDNHATLQAGTTESVLPVVIQGDMLLPGDYMLPVRLSEVSQFEISSNDLYPLSIRIMGEQLDRTNWTAEASSEEPAEAPNGYADKLIDGSTSTFWHSKWSGGQDPLPHEIIIDTQTEQTFTQFSLIRRENYNYVRSGEFYVSSDKNEWVKVGNFTMKDANGAQVFSVIPTTGRYFKILITQSNNGNNAALAEVYAYGIK